ncbi:hypothetical protein [Heliothis virescens ascovirus 3j]|uniref:Uncharacterized protein n=1 Tax=Heliothis virescens ascovirus 3j TaxID=1561067 RepID=A0A2Z5UZ95_9VIRU|nr:hypothetical protein [Heliothis virescens ascovirus 3j]
MALAKIRLHIASTMTPNYNVVQRETLKKSSQVIMREAQRIGLRFGDDRFEYNTYVELLNMNTEEELDRLVKTFKELTNAIDGIDILNNIKTIDYDVVVLCVRISFDGMMWRFLPFYERLRLLSMIDMNSALETDMCNDFMSAKVKEYVWYFWLKFRPEPTHLPETLRNVSGVTYKDLYFMNGSQLAQLMAHIREKYGPELPAPLPWDEILHETKRDVINV